MAGSCKIETKLNLTGLGEEITIADDYDVATTDAAPTAFNKQYRTLASGGMGELLDLGDVQQDQLRLIYIKAIDYDLDIDTSWVTSFSTELTILAGESQIFRVPVDNVIQVKNTTGVETPAYEYAVVGLT